MIQASFSHDAITELQLELATGAPYDGGLVFQRFRGDARDLAIKETRANLERWLLDEPERGQYYKWSELVELLRQKNRRRQVIAHGRQPQGTESSVLYAGREKSWLAALELAVAEKQRDKARRRLETSELRDYTPRKLLRLSVIKETEFKDRSRDHGLQ